MRKYEYFALCFLGSHDILIFAMSVCLWTAMTAFSLHIFCFISGSSNPLMMCVSAFCSGSLHTNCKIISGKKICYNTRRSESGKCLIPLCLRSALSSVFMQVDFCAPKFCFPLSHWMGLPFYIAHIFISSQANSSYHSIPTRVSLVKCTLFRFRLHFRHNQFLRRGISAAIEYPDWGIKC